jgi:Zn-finger nucleic acid-binding protein
LPEGYKFYGFYLSGFYFQLYEPAKRNTIMKCPNCSETLIMSDRQGVEIDYCPKCRGVWLDRGELDKIIERSAAYDQGQGGQQPDYPSQQQTPPPPYGQQPYGQDPYSHQPYNKYNDPYYKNKKKKGFLGDLFDFD